MRYFNTMALALVAGGVIPGAALGVRPGSVSGRAPAGDPGMTARAAAAPVKVVATLPVYADIARQIGGSEVDVTSIANPHEDSHFVRPKPSFAAKLRQADMFVTTGLDLELWAPPLLDKAGNASVAEGGKGYVTAYTGIHLLDVPSSADRAAGDIHIYGNPHVYTDPLNALQVARNITSGLKKVAPERSAAWDKGLADFTSRVYSRLFGDKLVSMLGGPTLEKLARSGNFYTFLEKTPYQGKPLISFLGGWLGKAQAFRGQDLICYHKNWAYFEDRFAVKCVDYVEAKPGIPPTPGHVASLIQLMKKQDIRVMIAATYFGEQKVATVANRAGGTYVMMPMEPGDQPGETSYFDMVDRWVNGVAKAFQSLKS